MNLRRIAAAALTAGAVLAPAAPAAATCYVGQIDICDMPTDPYIDPVTGAVVDVFVDTVNNPAVRPHYFFVMETAVRAYGTVVCTALC